MDQPEREAGNRSESSWIDARLEESRRADPSVSERVIDRMKELLATDLRDHQLRPKELGEVARELIADMEMKRED